MSMCSASLSTTHHRSSSVVESNMFLASLAPAALSPAGRLKELAPRALHRVTRMPACAPSSARKKGGRQYCHRWVIIGVAGPLTSNALPLHSSQCRSQSLPSFHRAFLPSGMYSRKSHICGYKSIIEELFDLSDIAKTAFQRP